MPFELRHQDDRVGFTSTAVKVVAAVVADFERRTVLAFRDLVFCALSAENALILPIEVAVGHVVSERPSVVDSVAIYWFPNAIDHAAELRLVVEVDLSATRREIAAINHQTSRIDGHNVANLVVAVLHLERIRQSTLDRGQQASEFSFRAAFAAHEMVVRQCNRVAFSTECPVTAARTPNSEALWPLFPRHETAAGWTIVNNITRSDARLLCVI